MPVPEELRLPDVRSHPDANVVWGTRVPSANWRDGRSTVTEQQRNKLADSACLELPRGKVRSWKVMSM
jgi:hypothetical protein